MRRTLVIIGVAWWLANAASAQPLATETQAPADPVPLAQVPAPAVDPAPAPAAEVAPPDDDSSLLSSLQIHGFVSEGAFVSTDNDYIGKSSRGSLKLFEGGINFSIEPVDQLRVGLQLVSRSVGSVSEEVPRIDWAVLDYRFERWLGLRAGIIKMPLGLYNEYVDIDSSRTSILLPQSMYPIRNRDALISHTGFAAYGSLTIGVAGDLDYQAWLGTLSIPRSALELSGATLDSTDTRYVTGGQLFWRLPIEGLRIGASYMRASIDFNLGLDADSVTQLVMAGAVPADFDGRLRISQSPTSFWVGSIEYVVGDFLFAAEYSRWLKHQETTLPLVIATIDEDAERFYVMGSYRFSQYFELGTYASVTHLDVDDRDGKSGKFAKRHQAYQRDLALSLRFDVNEYWLWKLEGHAIDGVGELQSSVNPNPTRYWGLFLLRTTVTF